MLYSLEIENILGRALLPSPGSLALLLIEPRGGKKGAMNTHSQKIRLLANDFSPLHAPY
jgi:hypothetical protein